MKKLYTILFLFVFLCAPIYAQQNKEDRIKAYKVAFITERLDLSSTEAERFWPVYNRYDKKLYQLRNIELNKIKRRIRRDDLNSMSDNDALSILNDIENIENQIYNQKKQLVNELRKILPPKKIIILKKVEDDFNRELIKRLRERREQRFQRRN